MSSAYLFTSLRLTNLETTKKKESQIHDVNIKTTEENYFVCTDTIQVMMQKIQDKKKKERRWRPGSEY